MRVFVGFPERQASFPDGLCWHPKKDILRQVVKPSGTEVHFTLHTLPPLHPFILSTTAEARDLCHPYKGRVQPLLYVPSICAPATRFAPNQTQHSIPQRLRTCLKRNQHFQPPSWALRGLYTSPLSADPKWWSHPDVPCISFNERHSAVLVHDDNPC